MTNEIDEFARIIVERVRDAAIKSSDRSLTANHKIAQRWREAAESKPPGEFAKTIIPDIVDETVFYLLHAIDDGLLNISFKAANGKVVDLSKDGNGELAGNFAGDNWKPRYSKERFSDNT